MTRSGAAQKHLLERSEAMLSLAKPDDHVFVVFDKGEVVEPMQLVDAKLLQGKRVAVYSAYVSTRDVTDPTLQLYELGRCGKKPEDCGLHSTPPCFKRHVQTVPLTSLRPPTFRVSEVLPSGNAAELSLPPHRETHRFDLPEGVLEQVRKTMDADKALA